VSVKQKRLKLAVNLLQPGIFIEMPGSWSDHPFIFNKFRISSQLQIDIIDKAGYDFVYVNIEKSKATPLPMPHVDLGDDGQDDSELSAKLLALSEAKAQQIEAMQIYRRSLQKCQDNYATALAKVHALTNKIQDRPLEAIETAQGVIGELAEQLSKKGDLVLHLVNDQRNEGDRYSHAVSVCVLSMLIGKYIELKEHEIIELGLAGLLHDVGKLKIPNHIYNSKTIGSEQRRYIIRQHPQYSVELLNNCPEINTNIKQAIMQHHEFADGSGYPKGLKLAQLQGNSLIVSLVNYYEKQRYPYNDDKPKSPAQALSYIYKFKSSLFDPQHIGAFIKTMGVFPPGTYVKLSNGQIGIVMTVTAKNILNPHVMVFDENIQRQEAAIIDTSAEEIKIEQALSAETLQPHVKEYLSPFPNSGIYLG